MLNPVQDLVMMADNMLMVDTMAIAVINNAPHQIGQWMIATAYIAIISPAITTSGTVLIVQSIHIRDAAAMFHSTIKSNAAAMFHNTIVKHAAVMFHNTTTHATANIVQSTLVKNAVVMFQATTTSMFASHNANHANHANHVVTMVMEATKQFFNCVSYFQTGRDFLPVWFV